MVRTFNNTSHLLFLIRRIPRIHTENSLWNKGIFLFNNIHEFGNRQIPKNIPGIFLDYLCMFQYEYSFGKILVSFLKYSKMRNEKGDYSFQSL